MIKNIVIFLCLSFSCSFAITLDEMLNNVYENNHDIKGLENSIESAKKQIDISNKWNNPVLSFGINDIQFVNTFQRDLEPMQNQFIGYSQIFPIGEKLKFKKEISIKDKKIAQLTLEEIKLQIKSKLYEYSYNIVILEKKYDLLNKYQKNLDSLSKLSQTLYENGKTKQTDIINIKINYSEVSLKKENLKNLIRKLYLKLEEITYLKITKIDLPIDVKKRKIFYNIDNHPKVLILKEKIDKFSKISKLELENKIPDIKFNLAYFQRDSKYKDFISMSVNVPLSIHNTENIKSLKAKIISKKIQNNLNSINQEFITKISIYENYFESSKKKYEIIKNVLIPLKQEIQKSIEIQNSFNQLKPEKIIENLNSLIKYEMMLLDELLNYFSYYSKLIYFQQGAI